MQFTSVVLSALALLSGARALQLNNPINAVSGEPLEISWKFRPEDPNFSLELFSPTLHDTFALADDVNPSDNAIVVTLPDVPTGSAAYVTFSLVHSRPRLTLQLVGSTSSMRLPLREL